MNINTLQSRTIPCYRGLFSYTLLLTGFFILLELSYFIQCNAATLSVFTFVSANLKIPAIVIPGILFFLFAQILVHLGYSLVVWFATFQIAKLFQLISSNALKLMVFIWLLGLITILTANQYFYPNSKFSELTSLVLPAQSTANVALMVLLSFCFIVLFLTVCQLLKTLFQQMSFFRLLGIVSVTIVSIIGVSLWQQTPKTTQDAATISKPNIVIIGMDSVRPDFLSFFGGTMPTPFLDSFLKQATVFNESVTPLARTYPSWVGILTGLYPKQTHVRFNLANQTNIRVGNALPTVLRDHGYETLYATDETRFSNIQTNLGFDRVISPPVGLNDFLIGTLNDFPISNLLINTIIGKWLFPYSYGNRPVGFSYDPNRFLDLISPALSQSRAKPLFLAVHFCLPHNPYLWAGLSATGLSMQQRYELSVQRVSQQVGDFFALLKQDHLLDHTIVIVLSDHGEALEFPGDRITDKDLYVPAEGRGRHAPPIPLFYPPSLEAEDVDKSAGHGTDVLGLSQYHTLLAFKLFGLHTQQQAVVPGLVSLLDIEPTLLAMLGIKPTQALSGYSLMDVINNKAKQAPAHHHVFLESDFSPEAIRTVYPEVRKVVLQGVALFQIDPLTAKLYVKDDMGNMIINSKQYADIDGEWMLALYPQGKSMRMPILVNLVSGEWTNDMRSDFARHSPVDRMLSDLRRFYGDEIS